MAPGGTGADQVLALDAAETDLDQGALAHRTRLRRAQAGDRAGALRRSRMARLSPSCDVIDCSLCLPGRRARPDSPLSCEQKPATAGASLTPRSKTPRIPRCGLSG